LTPVQMITYAVFVVFYIPCLATMIVIRKELGGKMMWQIVGMTTLIATLAGLFARGIAEVFY
ncbi:MAG: nucleoside recognition domain-containing protein, partial [Chloroflexota bacterium]|nr:nucleoside recognition domain-containing protein [Chloroflexota bacterium]